MFRAFHFTTELGFNMAKGILGLEAKTPDEVLQQLGGMYSKTCQFINIDKPNSSAFNECKPVNPEETEEIFKEYCDDYDISYKDTKFLASGSIGAVYKGKYKNKDVVFKVMYAGIEELWELDMTVLKNSVNVLSYISNDYFDVEQMSNIVKDELNYEKETENHKLIYKLWGKSDCFTIPKIYDEISNSEVICTEYMNFTPLCEYIQKLDQSKIIKLGEDLLFFFVENIFKYKLIYGDMHWGNLFHKDGKIVIIDFGLVTKIPDHCFEFYKKMLPLVHRHEKNKGFALIKKYYPHFSDNNVNNIYEAMEITYEQYRGKFKYTREYTNKVLSLITLNMKLPDGLVLIVRNQVLLMGLLEKLNVEIDTHKIISKYFAELQK